MNKILGNKRLISTLKQDASSNNLLHAIIFEGVEGSGKKMLAEYVCLLLNCRNTPDICYSCPSCRKILAHGSPDIISTGVPDGKTQIGVDTVRFIRSDAYVRPNDNEHKIYIIDSADKMSTEAQNAFLKVFEEPPPYAIFILLCESADVLLPTIRSRARVYRTEIFSCETLSKYLCENSAAANEFKSKNPEAFKLALLLSHGSIGRALKNISPENAQSNYELYIACAQTLKMLKSRNSAYSILNHITSLELSKELFGKYLDMLEYALSDIMAFKLCKEHESQFFTDEDELISIATSLTTTFILEAVKLVEDHKTAIYQNASQQNITQALAFKLYGLRAKY